MLGIDVPVNAPVSILVRVLGRCTSVRKGQSRNTPILSSHTPLGTVTFFINRQPLNAYPWTVVTPSGILNSVSVLPAGYVIRVVPFLVYSTPSLDRYFLVSSATVISLSDAQFPKAFAPIRATPFGIFNVVMPEHP